MKKINRKLSRIDDKRTRMEMRAAEGSTVVAGERDYDGCFPVSIVCSGSAHFLVSNRNGDLYDLLSRKPTTLGELRRAKPRDGRRAKSLSKAISRVVDVADYVLDDLIVPFDATVSA